MRRLEDRIRDLERLLGRKTMEIEISAELAKRGHLTASGKPYVVTAVWAMLR